MKPLRDYQKIRSLVGWILRNKFFQGKRPNQAQVAYLQIGCGPQVAPGFINLDYRWVPGVDVVWDLNVPLPFPAQRFQGIFAEHVLEHLDDDTLLKVLKEALRILRPGGGASYRCSFSGDSRPAVFGTSHRHRRGTCAYDQPRVLFRSRSGFPHPMAQRWAPIYA